MDMSRFLPWVKFVVTHTGVSKEAGRNYSRVRSAEEWRELAVDAVGESFDIGESSEDSESSADTLLAIRHTVSSADIVEALGAHGHERAVTHNGRLVRARGIAQDDPRYSAEMFAGVTWVHVNKHSKLCQWIHNPALRAVAIQRWDDMVDAYRKWSIDLGFEPVELKLAA